MLHTNLSTRPFYNTRVVRAGLGVVAMVAAGLTVFNSVELWRLQQANRELGQAVNQNESQARELRQKARTVQQSINKAQLSQVDAAAREANELIDRRTFSWTALLNQFQATLPSSVRIVSVEPQIDPAGRLLVAITVRSRQQEDLDGFIAALEQTGAFQDVLSRTDSAVEDGTLMSVLQAYYNATPEAAIPAPPASKPGTDAPVNRTPANVVAGGPR